MLNQEPDIKTSPKRNSPRKDIARAGETKKQQVPVNLTPGAKLTPEELKKIIRNARIDPKEEIKEPPVCLQLIDQGVTSNVCTLGNFSLAIGKAKSRKSFFASLAFAIVTGFQTEKFSGGLIPEKNTGIYFDTEQGRYHVLRLMRRICNMVGKPEPENIQVYSLRKYPPHIRLQVIEEIIYTTEKVGFVVIDGVRDLVTSINDEDQATDIATRLLKWTEERNIHIMGVLHQNKGDANARGHLGAELTNKAETVLSITKNDDNRGMSVVEAEYCRDIDFNPFGFTIDADQVPQVDPDWKKQKPKSKEVPENISDVNTYSVLSKCFSMHAVLTYDELKTQIKLSYRELHNKDLGAVKIKELIQKSRNEMWLLQESGWRKPYTLGKYKQ